MKRSLVFASMLSSILAAVPARAADFFVDPVNGSMGNDGSAAAPWSTTGLSPSLCSVT